MDPGAGDLETPSDGFALNVFGAEEALAAEEVLPNVRHLAFDVRFSRRVASHGRVDDEASVLGVLAEGSLEDRVVAIGFGDGCRQVVFDDTGCDTAKGLPGHLQTIDDVLERLVAGDVHVHVAAVDQDHDQGPEQLPALGLGIEDVTQTTEVDLANLSRFALRATDGDLPLAELAVLDRKTVERAVGNSHPMPLKENVDLGQSQAPFSLGPAKPLMDLLPPGKQESLALTRFRFLGSGSQAGQDPDSQGLIGFPVAGPPPQLRGQAKVVANRLSIAACCCLDVNLVLPPVKAAKNLSYFPHPVLLVDHPYLLGWR